MKEIFTDLYNKVMGFFQKQDESDHTENAKDVAYNRLKLVLMQDRTNLTPLLLEKMRGEMIEVLSKYVEMDKDALELNFEQEGDSMALMLSIPVLRAKDEAEIQAALEEKEKCTQCDCEYKDSDMLCEDCPKVQECECVEDVCANCDCEFKDSNTPCEECPKVQECECVEDACAACDCEYKNSDLDCEDCEKKSDCNCKKAFDEAKQDLNQDENSDNTSSPKAQKINEKKRKNKKKK